MLIVLFFIKNKSTAFLNDVYQIKDYLLSNYKADNDSGQETLNGNQN